MLLLAYAVNIIHCKVWWDIAKIGVESGVAPVKTKLSAKEIISINHFIAVYNLIQGYLPDEINYIKCFYLQTTLASRLPQLSSQTGPKYPLRFRAKTLPE